jgi:hypothetical protein
MYVVIDNNRPHTTEAPTLEQGIRRLARRSGLSSRQAETSYLRECWRNNQWQSGYVCRRVHGHEVHLMHISWRHYPQGDEVVTDTIAGKNTKHY